MKLKYILALFGFLGIVILVPMYVVYQSAQDVQRQLNLAAAKIVDLDETRELRPRWRTNGVGLPGYQAGWFKLADGEKALLFVTDPTAVLYIPTGEGYSLLMSVLDAPRFLASIKKQHSRHGKLRTVPDSLDFG